MKLHLVAIGCTLLASARLAWPDDSMSAQTSHSFVQTIQTHVKTRYLLYLPATYEAGSNRRWPLMLFLHGMGERGDDLNRVKSHGPPKLIEQGTNFPFIVVSPQCPLGAWWTTETLNALLDDVMTRHAVDTNRIYLTGLSMGGFGSFELALCSPQRFAAVVPICGGGNPFPLHGFDDRRAALISVPFWVFHGSADPVVPVIESERMVQALEKFGCRIKLTVYPEVQHDSWTQTYDNPEFYQWLLQQQRVPAKP